tara:strand:+ start:1130 stop:3061 length:1932 start_codon:yes stop_codon:yes gene_type:complete
MAKVLTSLELGVIVEELRASVLNSKVSKIFIPKSKTLRLELHKTGLGRQTLIIDSGVGVYLSSFKFDNPEIPPSFAMFLRRHLNQSILKDITQKEGERIIELRFNTKDGTKFLICELFGRGNFILTDAKYVILNSAVIKKTKDRTVKKGEIYVYPDVKFDVKKLSQGDFEKGLVKWENYQIVKFLASGLTLGGLYAEEVCSRAGVDKSKLVNSLADSEKSSIFTALSSVLRSFGNISPLVILEDGKEINAVPFELKAYSDYKSKTAKSFSAAVDVLLSGEKVVEIRGRKEKSFVKGLEKVERIISSQERSIAELNESREKIKQKVDAINSNYEMILKVLDKIRTARADNHSWEDIISVLEREKSSGIPEAEIVEEISASDGVVIMDIGGFRINFDLKKKIENLTDTLYSEAKRLNSKISGAERTLNSSLADKEKLLSQRDAIMAKVDKSVPKAIERVPKKWYEKFHWFNTSNGLLAVGGRDATSNEILVKKHLEVRDLVFHTSLAGSPFFVLKGGQDGVESDFKEVATATASYSRSWSMGLGSADVFYVRPEQISKKAQAGEYLVKGSFMIRGKRTFIDADMKLGVGVIEGAVVGGPVSVVSDAVVVPGKHKKSDVAKLIAKRLKVGVDEVMSVLPNGGSDLS